MHPKALSTAFFYAILATEVVGGVLPSAKPKTPVAINNKKTIELGALPSLNYKRFAPFCSTPWKKQNKRNPDHAVIQARTPPTGPYRLVRPGEHQRAGPSDGFLYSPDFGTCVGVIVLGRPRAPGATTNRFLAHLTTFDEASIRVQFNNFATAIANADLEVSHIYMYTPDTRINNRELPQRQRDAQGRLIPKPRGSPDDLADIAQDVEDLNWVLFRSLSTLSSRVIVQRVYHSFGRTGEIIVPVRGQIVFNPHS